ARLAEVAELAAVHERRRRRRHEHLPAVTGSRDARRTVDVGADVSLLREERSAGVETHPDRQLELVLRLARHLERSGRGCEGDEECVALRVDLDTVVSLERLAQNPSVLGERIRISVRAE